MPAVTIDELTVADEPASWAALGFAVEGDACRIGGVRLRFAGRGAGRGIVGWALRGAASTELDGLPTTRAEDARGAGSADVADGAEDGRGAGSADVVGGPAAAAADEPPAPAHPNGVTALDHVVVVTPQLDRSVAALQAAGLDLRRIREQPTPAGAPRQAFFRLGAEIVEVVQAPVEAIERTGGSDGPAIFWGLALLVPDLHAAVAGLGEHVSDVRAAVQPGREIASLRRSAGLALPLALMTP